MTTIPTTVMRASKTQRDRTIAEEGLKLQAYKDTIGIWTIGVGHAATNPNPVRGVRAGEYYEGPPDEGVTITALEAERLFNLDFDETERGVSSLVSAPLMQNQFDTLCDFVHQFGLGALGGSTLLLKINRNPNNLGAADNDTGILHELMRWTRAGGDHQEYVWRRSARRACVYAGAPIPQALWRPKGFPFAVTADDKIDYSITPTIYKLIEYGKKAAEPYKFDPSKISLEPKPDTSITIITDKPIEKPAAVSPAAGASESVSPLPSGPGPKLDPVAPSPSASVPVSGEAKVVPAPAPPNPPPVIAPKGIDVRSIPYGEMDPENPQASNMSGSRRVIGMVIVGFGSIVQILAAREIISSSIGAVFYDMSRDPVLVALAAGAGTMFLGWLTRKRGVHVIATGMAEARTVLK